MATAPPTAICMSFAVRAVTINSFDVIVCAKLNGWGTALDSYSMIMARAAMWP